MGADRLLDTLNLLRARTQWTAAALADELGVSVRTVYRYVEALRSTGVPIAGEAGVGYRLGVGFELPPLTFDADELSALVTGVRMVQRYADPELGAAGRRALHKIEAALPPEARGAVRRTALFVPRIDRDGVSVVPKDSEAPPWLSKLRRALDLRRKVQLEYEDGRGAFSERVVRPVGLFFWGRHWSVGAWCELRADWRSFRADRIRDLHVGEATWTEEGDFTADAFITAMQARG